MVCLGRESATVQSPQTVLCSIILCHTIDPKNLAHGLKRAGGGFLRSANASGSVSTRWRALLNGGHNELRLDSAEQTLATLAC